MDVLLLSTIYLLPYSIPSSRLTLKCIIFSEGRSILFERSLFQIFLYHEFVYELVIILISNLGFISVIFYHLTPGHPQSTFSLLVQMNVNFSLKNFLLNYQAVVSTG